MRRTRKLLTVLLLLVLLVLGAMGTLVLSGMNDRIGRADVALVLGNKVNPDGSPSPRLQARLDTAADLFRKGYFPKIVVSGGTGPEGVPEGTAMKAYLVAEGIPGASILVDDHGDNTRASAANAVAIMQAGEMDRVFVITQFFHVPRCRLALSKLGISRIYHSHPRYFEARDIYSTLRELPAYVSYLLREP